MSLQDSDIYGWQLAEVTANRRALFVLWAVKTLFCTTMNDFVQHYKISEDELAPLLNELLVQGFLQQDDENYVLTSLGETAVNYLGQLEISQFAHPERPGEEVKARFTSVKLLEALPAPEIAKIDRADTAEIFESKAAEERAPYNSDLAQRTALRFWAGREQDRGKPEATLVELPFVQQLVQLGWIYQPGDTGAPEGTHRSSFREVIIEEHLRAMLPRINRDEESGEIWLDEPRVEQAINDLKRIFTTYTNNVANLMRANEDATALLLRGTPIAGTQELHRGTIQNVRFIDFVHPLNNHFVVINQFRVDLAGARYIVPDIVLFVNGIPLAVIECKNPGLTNPLEEGITQLLRYSGQYSSADLQSESEAAPQLFYFNQLLLVSCFFQARSATLGSSYEHFQEWKVPYPLSREELAQKLGTAHVSSQQTLIEGIFPKYNLLDLLYNFTLFQQTEGRTIKLVARYHQYRAVREAIKRLQENPTRQQDGEEDRRGGIIWHTQGSGKSLTMMFLVRKMRTIRELRDFKIVFVTDRSDLQRQLRTTAALTEETAHTASLIRDLEPLLLPEGPRLVFAMIQKYRGRRRPGYRSDDEDAYNPNEDEASDEDDEADPGINVINTSENILVIVDEAHRSQARKLHANLKKAMPDCARIAFTGTPIILGHKKKTYEIFGNYIDEYTIKESEQDGATLPILYEGREAYIEVTQKLALDEKHDQIVQALSQHIRESLRDNFETYREILEAPNLIAKKAEDMLMHYATNILPNGFKAMVVAVSRLAAIRYRDALEAARQSIVSRLDQLPPEQHNLPEELIKHLDENDEIKQLMHLYPLRDTLQQLEFAAIVSPSASDLNYDRVDWHRWTNEEQHVHDIEEFKKPLWHSDASQRSPLAFLCVRSMLITGFDAPILQALYLDRSIKDHELLQAIARVNRPHLDKTTGLVVDYFGIANNLKEALQAYSQPEVQGALASIKDELPLLADRHRRAIALFQSHNLSLDDVDGCVNLLQDTQVRSDFTIKLKKFMESLDVILPRPEGLDYIDDAQRLGLINRAASTTYRDEQLNLINIGNKVRKLIDEHIDALKIRQQIEPISIFDEHFERKLRRHTSDQTNAVEMEHLARDYISHYFEQEDPAYYHKLSERLDEIVNTLHENWLQRVDALEAFIKEAREPRRIDNTGLDPRTERPFLGILEEEVRKGSQRFSIVPDTDSVGRELREDELQQLADFTRTLVQFIRDEIRDNDDFWLSAQKQERLTRLIVRMLQFDGKRLLAPHTRREAVAARLVSLAHALTARLRSE